MVSEDRSIGPFTHLWLYCIAIMFVYVLCLFIQANLTALIDISYLGRRSYRCLFSLERFSIYIYLILPRFHSLYHQNTIVQLYILYIYNTQFTLSSFLWVEFTVLCVYNILIHSRKSCITITDISFTQFCVQSQMRKITPDITCPVQQGTTNLTFFRKWRIQTLWWVQNWNPRHIYKTRFLIFWAVEKVVKKMHTKKLQAKQVWRTWVKVKKVHISVPFLLITFQRIRNQREILRFFIPISNF